MGDFSVYDLVVRHRDLAYLEILLGGCGAAEGCGGRSVRFFVSFPFLGGMQAGCLAC